MIEPHWVTIMVVFERFRATNAGPFKEFDLNLRNRGLIRMVGANGQGKSTIWHLFTQNHYSITPNSAKKSDLMKSDKDYLLETTFTKNGSTYVAAQAVKSKTLSPAGTKYDTGVYLFRDGTDISLHKDPDTQKLIKSTLGWSLEEWFGYVYLAQQTTHTLINGTRSERQTYLSALFNMFWIDSVASELTKKSKDLSESISNIEEKNKEYNIKLSLLNGRSLESLSLDVSSFQEEVSFLEDQESELRLEQQRFKRKKDLERSLSSINQPNSSLEEISKSIEELVSHQAKFDAQEKVVFDLRRKIQSLPSIQVPTIPSDYEEIMSRSVLDIEHLTKEYNSLLSIKRNLSPQEPVILPDDLFNVLESPDLNESYTVARIEKIKNRPLAPSFPRPNPDDLDSLQEKINGFRVESISITARVKSLQFNESSCPTCGTTLNCEDRASELEEKANELEFVKQAIKDLEHELSEVKRKESAWRQHDLLGPDESESLPSIIESLNLYRKKQEYKKLVENDRLYKAYEDSLDRLKSLPYYEEQIAISNKQKQYSLLSEQKEKYERLVSEKTELDNKLNEQLEHKLEDKSQELGALRVLLKDAEVFFRLKEEMESLQGCEDQAERLSAILSVSNELKSQIGSKKRELEEVQSLVLSIQDLQKYLSENQFVYREKIKYDLLAKGYGKAGQLRERQLARFSRYLEDALISHTIRQLPNHKFKIVVDDGIDILAVKSGDRPEPYDVKFMSGGEKGALSVAFLFALDDLLPPDRRSSLKILDEIEGAFDGDRKKDFIDHTLPELKKRAETIIVISHSEAASYGAFDSTWEIKDGMVVERKSERREFELTE